MTPFLPRKKADVTAAAVDRDWTEQPEARALIMEMIATGAQPTAHFATYAQTRDHWRVFEGPLAERLETLRDDWLMANAADRANWGRQRTVAEAIDQATADPSVIASWMAEQMEKAA